MNRDDEAIFVIASKKRLLRYARNDKMSFYRFLSLKEYSKFVWPKGERYPNMPTEEQLKVIYGK